MAKRSLLITGVPGTGKSTVAGLLSEKTGAALIDINKLVNVLKLYSAMDETDGAKIVRLKELQGELSAAINGAESARHCRGPSRLRDGAAGLKGDSAALRAEGAAQRLASGRNYPPEKIAANALSEALDYCTVLSEKNYGKRKVWEIDTTEDICEKVADECEKIILGKRRKKGGVLPGRAHARGDIRARNYASEGCLEPAKSDSFLPRGKTLPSGDSTGSQYSSATRISSAMSRNLSSTR